MRVVNAMRYQHEAQVDVRFCSQGISKIVLVRAGDETLGFYCRLFLATTGPQPQQHICALSLAWLRTHHGSAATARKLISNQSFREAMENKFSAMNLRPAAAGGGRRGDDGATTGRVDALQRAEPAPGVGVMASISVS